MRRVTAILSVAAVVLTAAVLGAQAKPSFAGEWKIVADQGLGEPGKDLTILQSASAITVEYKAGSLAPAPVKLTYNLDGAASKNMMAGRGAPTEQVSKAMWVANKLVVSTTTGAGEEKRTFSMEGDNLVVETSTPARGGAPNVAKVTYKRYERGHGG